MSWTGRRGQAQWAVAACLPVLGSPPRTSLSPPAPAEGKARAAQPRTEPRGTEGPCQGRWALGRGRAPAGPWDLRRGLARSGPQSSQPRNEEVHRRAQRRPGEAGGAEAALTMLLVQQLHLLQHVLAHLREAGAGLLAAAQDQAVLVVACAHAVQGLLEGLGGEQRVRDPGGTGCVWDRWGQAWGQAGSHPGATWHFPKLPGFL